MIKWHSSLIHLHSSSFVSHSSSLVCIRLSFVFDSSLLVCTSLSFVFTRLHSSALVFHSSALVLSLVSNISNNPCKIRKLLIIKKASANICYMRQHFCIHWHFGNDCRIRIHEILSAFYRCSEVFARGVFGKKCVLKIFAKLIGKRLCRRVIFDKIIDTSPTTLLKRDSNTGEFSRIFKIIFFWQHFRWLHFSVPQNHPFQNLENLLGQHAGQSLLGYSLQLNGKDFVKSSRRSILNAWW